MVMLMLDINSFKRTGGESLFEHLTCAREASPAEALRRQELTRSEKARCTAPALPCTEQWECLGEGIHGGGRQYPRSHAGSISRTWWLVSHVRAVGARPTAAGRIFTC